MIGRSPLDGSRSLLWPFLSAICFSACEFWESRRESRLISYSDTAAFGAIQVLPSWLRQFGDYDAESDIYFNPTTRTSLMNAIVL
jgi:hypothetical protein